MNTYRIHYVSRSIKIRERINSEREDIPKIVDEPVAVFTKDYDGGISMCKLRLNSKLKDRNDFPYQTTSKQMYLLVDAGASLCSVGYKRDHPASSLTKSGPTTIWEPEVILPQGGIITIAPAQVESLVEALYGKYSKKRIYQNLDNAPVEKVIDDLASTDGYYDPNFEAFFKANVENLQGFHEKVKSEAKQLCQRSGFEGCELPLRVLLTRYEFIDNVPLNPSEEVFSLEKHLAREEELLKKYRT